MGIPGVHQGKENEVEVQNWFVSQAHSRQNQTNKKRRVTRKKNTTPPNQNKTIKHKVRGHFVLFLRQYYPSPFILYPSKLTHANHPRWMFAPRVKIKIANPAGFEPIQPWAKGLSQMATDMCCACMKQHVVDSVSLCLDLSSECLANTHGQTQFVFFLGLFSWLLRWPKFDLSNSSLTATIWEWPRSERHSVLGDSSGPDLIAWLCDIV